ncbi:hypothetical protein WN67_00820 [Mycolicibacterium obuense]|uniref:Uncharacterized protein n=1 Tax=Mycolicibacterium obuense TaxID=1807 RepID=A0A0M2K368_9MYCO|nr:hypothetical protein WN67_00820 [Mycolicibacterium obuense]
MIHSNDRHHPIRREHLKHFVVIGFRERPIFDDAGVTCHLDDERVIIRSRRTKQGALSCHCSIVADAVYYTHAAFAVVHNPPGPRAKVPFLRD